MKVLVAGANGATGRSLLTYLHELGHSPRAMIRDERQYDGVMQAGAFAVVQGDLEQWDLEQVVRGVDAVVFAAGSGGHTGHDRTISVDLMGAIRLIEACRAHGPDRFVMLSSMGTRAPHAGRGEMRHYFTAKAEADDWLMRSDLIWTIARPGRLSHDPPARGVTLAPELERGDPLSRDDLAEVLARCLDEPATEHKVFELTAGTTPIPEALASL